MPQGIDPKGSLGEDMMGTKRSLNSRNIRAVLILMALQLVLCAWSEAAEVPQAAGVISHMAGRVEVLPRGQTTWQAARTGTRVSEGDQVRSLAGGNAELRLPDTSTVFVAENSRIAVTRLDFDAKNQMRSAFFHLAAGKLRGVGVRAAAAPVQTRQSNFAISTPTAVAAVRGTTLYASFDPTTNTATFLVTDGVAMIRDLATGHTVTVAAGQVFTHTPGQALSAPAPASPAEQAQITAEANPAAPGTATVLDAATVTVAPADVVSVQIAPPPAVGAPPAILVTPPPPPGPTRDASPFKK
jgi:hypothetical protein